MDKCTKKDVFRELNKYDHLANKDNFIEVTDWKNDNGFGVDILGELSARFQLTWGEFTTLKSSLKSLMVRITVINCCASLRLTDNQ